MICNCKQRTIVIIKWNVPVGDEEEEKHLLLFFAPRFERFLRE